MSCFPSTLNVTCETLKSLTNYWPERCLHSFPGADFVISVGSADNRLNRSVLFHPATLFQDNCNIFCSNGCLLYLTLRVRRSLCGSSRFHAVSLLGLGLYDSDCNCTMKSFGICCFSSNRSFNAEPQHVNYGPSVIAPFDLEIMVCAKASNYRLPSARSTMEENHDLLQLETKGTAGSFFSRLLTREESTGNSSRIYYRAPHLGRVPFNWEAEPGKRKSSGRYYEELVHHEIIPPLSPPPSLQAKSVANSVGSSSRKTGVGLLHKIHNYFQQRKSSQAKSKQFGSGNGKNRGRWVYSDWEIYGAEETEIDGESEFSGTSFGSSTRVRMI